MKVSRNTVWITLAISILAVLVCFLLEFMLPGEVPHRGFYMDLAMGVFTGGVLSLIMALIQYFKSRQEKFFILNTHFMSIRRCMSMHDLYLSSKAQLPTNIKMFARAYEARIEMNCYLNDFKTFFNCGFKYKHIERIHDLMLKREFSFWADYDNAQEEDEYIDSFLDSVVNRSMIQ